jgi:alanine racemase
MKALIIEKDKLLYNIEVIKGMTGSTIIAVLKGNGYGLGILEYARFLRENSIDFFALSELDDALMLRENGFDSKLLLISSTSFEDDAEKLVANSIMPTVGSINSARAINEAAKKLETIASIHLKIDTGFGRFGFAWDKPDEIAAAFKDLDNIKIDGTYSHLSFAFEKKPKNSLVQFQKFNNCVESLKANGIDTGMLHIASSSAFLRFPQMHLDAVRVGSAFLGRIPIQNCYGLKKVAYLKSNIIETKELPEKHYIGYANTFRTKRKTRIGIIPVGYMDGFGVEKSRDTYRFMDVLRYMYNDFKSYHKKFYVRLADQKQVPILGRISMFNIVVDLTGTDAKIGDEVFLDVNPILVESTLQRQFI